MVTIVDYGMGNIGSVYNMFRKIGSKCIITSQIPDIENAEKIVLPGVGAYDSGMEQLENLGLKDVIRKKALEDQIPMLGICLGAQLMLAESEEGNKKGLGLLGVRLSGLIFQDCQNPRRFLTWAGIWCQI